MLAKIFGFLDFIPGWKTKAGVVAYILGHLTSILTVFGVDPQWAKLIGNAISEGGAFLATYGTAVAALRNVPVIKNADQAKNG